MEEIVYDNILHMKNEIFMVLECPKDGNGDEFYSLYSSREEAEAEAENKRECLTKSEQVKIEISVEKLSDYDITNRLRYLSDCGDAYYWLDGGLWSNTGCWIRQRGCLFIAYKNINYKILAIPADKCPKGSACDMGEVDRLAREEFERQFPENAYPDWNVLTQ